MTNKTVCNQPQVLNVPIQNIKVHQSSVRNIHSEKNQEFIQFLVKQHQLVNTIKPLDCYCNGDGTYTILDGVLRYESSKCLNLNNVPIFVDPNVPKSEEEFLDMVLVKNLYSPNTVEEKLQYIKNLLRICGSLKSTKSKEDINSIITLVGGKGFKRNNAITFRLIIEFDHNNPNDLNLPLNILNEVISIDEGKKILQIFQDKKFKYDLKRENKNKLIKGILDGRINATKVQEMLLKQQIETDYTIVNPAQMYLDNRYEVTFGDSREKKFSGLKMLDGCYTSIPYRLQIDNYSGDRSLMSNLEIGHENSVEEYIDGIVTVFSNAKENFKDTAVIGINVGDTYRGGVSLAIPQRIVMSMMDAGFLYLGQKLWVKNDAKPVSNRIKRDRDNYETILLFSITKDYHFQKLKFRNDSKTKEIKGNCSEQGTKNKKGFHVSNDYDTISNFMDVQRFSDMIELNQSKGRSKIDFHGDFSFLLPISFILQYIPENGVVWDPFGGTGTVGRSALLLNRKVIISELYEHNQEAILNNIKMGLENYDTERFSELDENYVEETKFLNAG